MEQVVKSIADFLREFGGATTLVAVMALYIFLKEREESKQRRELAAERARQDDLDTKEILRRQQTDERWFKMLEGNNQALERLSTSLDKLDKRLDESERLRIKQDDNYLDLARTVSERDEKHIERISDVGHKVDALGGKVDIVGHAAQGLAKAVDGNTAIVIDKADKTDATLRDLQSKIMGERDRIADLLKDMRGDLNLHAATSAKDAAETIDLMKQMLSEVRKLANALEAKINVPVPIPEVKQETVTNANPQ